ncbi:MAG: alpha-galactosidase [Thermoproteota archaeon]
MNKKHFEESSEQKKNLDFIEAWLNTSFSRDTLPPFSFIYGEKHSSEFIKAWKFSEKKIRENDKQRDWVFVFSSPEQSLVIRCEVVAFKDFPAVEWVLKLKNESNKVTPIVESVKALDYFFNGEGEFILHRALGSNAQRNDFAPIEEYLQLETPLRIAPLGGRSSNTTALPFFNLERRGQGGVIIGIGWSGQWIIEFERKKEGVNVYAGMELVHLKLYPKEEIRTPRILLLFWRGDDYIQSQNLLRRFLITHHIPKLNGKPVSLPFSCTSSGPPEEANRASVENQLEFVVPFVKYYSVEYLWIDAGWFDGGWPNGVGNWFPRKDGFPQGFLPLTQEIKRMGMKGLILWFEPERVYRGTWIDKEHPNWVLWLPGNPNGLLNLGNEEALKWLIDYLSQMIEREGISVYRQDFNMDPLPYWRSADLPDRQGITELRHVEGLYKLWDELLRRHPGLIIDNCASGGRRIDLETLSRSVVLWRTDYQYFEPNGQQCHTYGISFYLPTTATSCGYPNTYLFRSAMGNGMGLWVPWSPKALYDIYRKFLPPLVDWTPYKPFPLELARGLVEEFKQVREFFYGDYYPLSPYSTSDDAWLAYQFHREDLKGGIVFIFRRQKCSRKDFPVKFKRLNLFSNYELIISDDNLNKRKCILTGEQLMYGVTFSIENAPGSLLITYKEKPH